MSHVRAVFKTKSEIIADDLRIRINSGEIAPEQRLLLKDIARDFSCSEIPVRDALRSLAAASLVELVPHGGAYVSRPNVDEIIELTEVRALLEPEATCLSAPHLTPAAIDELDYLLREMATPAARRDPALYGQLNRRFHAVIIGACPNRKLVAMIADVWDRAQRGMLVYKRGDAFIAESLRHHAEFVRLIRAGDLAGLRALSERHSQFGLDAVRELRGWEATSTLKRTATI